MIPPVVVLSSYVKLVAQHLYQFRGIRAEPEQIIIGAGTQVLYNLIVQLLGRNHIYALEDPGYPQLAAIYKANNVFCRYLPWIKNGVSREMLENSGADILHITPSHQFPTGIIMPASRRYELLHWAGQSSSRYIIEAVLIVNSVFMVVPFLHCKAAIQQKRLSISIPFLKPLAPTFRISYMVLPSHLTTLFYQKLGFYSCTVSNFEQFTLAKFIEGGYFERHLNRMRTYYRNKCDKLLQYLAKNTLAFYLTVKVKTVVYIFYCI